MWKRGCRAMFNEYSMIPKTSPFVAPRVDSERAKDRDRGRRLLEQAEGYLNKRTLPNVPLSQCIMGLIRSASPHGPAYAPPGAFRKSQEEIAAMIPELPRQVIVQHNLNGEGLYRDTSLIRNSAPLGLCSRTMPRALWWP